MWTCKRQISALVAGVLSACLCVGEGQADDSGPPESVDELVFLLSPPSKPPFWYFDADQPRGIVFDLFTVVAERYGVEARAEMSSRNRADRQVQVLPDRVIPRALEWMPMPEGYLYTDTLVDSPDVLVSNMDDPIPYKGDLQTLNGLSVGTHFGYFYPVLEPLFHTGELVRTDFVSEVSMLKSVLNKRIQAIVMARPVVRWYIRQNDWYQRFYVSEQEISGFGIRLFFHPQQYDFVEFFNQELDQMRRDGRWQEIVDRYQ